MQVESSLNKTRNRRKPMSSKISGHQNKNPIKQKYTLRQIEEIQNEWGEITKNTPQKYKILYLNNRGSIVEVADIQNSEVIDPVRILTSASGQSGYSQFVVAQNTKDGNVYPKTEDRELIKLFAKAGRKLGLPLRDYFIISLSAIYSHKSSIDF